MRSASCWSLVMSALLCSPNTSGSATMGRPCRQNDEHVTSQHQCTPGGTPTCGLSSPSSTCGSTIFAPFL
jgi:hypothetical protein